MPHTKVNSWDASVSCGHVSNAARITGQSELVIVTVQLVLLVLSQVFSECRSSFLNLCI